MHGAPLEIERSYLLSKFPQMPQEARELRILQGYLPAGGETEGRIRSITYPCGETKYVHTQKSGTGLIRTEVERDLTKAQFDELWGATEGRRLLKSRFEVRHAEFVWEVDRYDNLDLVLAEVELPTAASVAEIPPWMVPYVIREVTDEPGYRNFDIAGRIRSEDGIQRWVAPKAPSR